MAEKSKVALVTGSALNIGRQIALALAAGGYRVMTTARNSETDARETARLVRDAGGEADTHMADISDPTQAAGLVAATVQRFGRLDVLVNNASLRRQTKFAEMTPAGMARNPRRNAGRRVLLRARRGAAYHRRGRRLHREHRRHLGPCRRCRTRACRHGQGRHGRD